MRWCRLYVETPSDPKLRRIAHTAGATVAHVLAVWSSMLCCAAGNEGEAWGTLAGWDDLDCAINLGIDKAIVFAIRREMEGRTIDGERIIAWEKRQSESDHAAIRMRKWRERKRAENQSPKPHVTSQSRHGDGDVTVRREEKRRDKEAKASSARAPAREVVLPAWLPASAWAEWCAYRKGRTWTQRAAELCVAKLDALREAGHDPEAVIHQSIANGWTGLFEVKRAQSAQRGKLDWMDTDPLFRGDA